MYLVLLSECINIFLKTKFRILLILALSVFANSVFAEEAITSEALPNSQDVLQNTTAEQASNRPIRKIVKPNRSQMKASVLNAKAGNVFLIDNATKQGVVKLKSGLQYRIIKAGAGLKPKVEDIVKCNYKGTLIDGTVFEQSEPGKPANIKVAPLLPGLKEAVMLMPAGSKWDVYVPAELGFGSEGKSPKVGPDAVLIYNLEVLEVKISGASKP